MIKIAVWYAALLVAVASARADSVGEVLARVAEHARFTVPCRAEVRIECSEPCPQAGNQAILLGRDDAVYVELRSGLRALVTPTRVAVAEGGKRADAAPGRTLADTNILLEDLAVFTPASLQVPQISDDGPAGTVVTSAPAGRSAYALLVYTIDQQRDVFTRTLYYRDSVSNLVKTRRDTGFVQVGGRSRPGEVTVESVRGPTTKLTLAWREAPDTPATAFDPARLDEPSTTTWP